MKTVKICYLILILMSCGHVFAKSSEKTLSHKKLSQLSFNDAQALRFAYIKFIQKTKNHWKNSRASEVPDTVFYNGGKALYDYFSAYGADGDLCWFGGWPSKLDANLCKHPSTVRNDSEIKKLGDVYSGENSCGNLNYFRCNPVLFGKPVDLDTQELNNVDVLKNPKNGNDKGYCVKVGNSFDDLSQKCEEVSRASIPKIIDGIRKDKTKQDQILNFQKGIFGEDGNSGFCGTFRTNEGEVYDACDDLKKRINELLAKQEEVAEKPDENLPPVDPYAQAKSVLSGCEAFLNAEGDDDVFSRNILANIHGGLIQCSGIGNTLPAAVITESGLEDLSSHFSKASYAQNLMESHFENSLIKILSHEIAFMRGTGIKNFSDGSITTNIDAFRSELKEHFPLVDEDEFNDVFKRVYKNISDAEKQNQIPTFKYEEMATKFKTQANSTLNKMCQEINADYKDKAKNVGSGKSKALARKNFKNLYMKQKNEEIKIGINNFQSNSELGFLLATDTFEDEILDPDTNFAEECIENSGYKIVRDDLTRENYANALKEVREILNEDLEDLADRSDDPDEVAEYYLKYEKGIVLKELINAVGDEAQTDQTKYICSRAQDIYKSDWWIEKGAIVGGGALAGLSSLLCLVPAGVTQVACAAGIAAGSSIAAGGAIDKGIDAYNRVDQSTQEIMRGDQDFASYQVEQKTASGQMKGAVVDGILSTAPLPFLKVKNVAKIPDAAKDTSTVLKSPVSRTGREMTVTEGRATAGASDDTVILSSERIINPSVGEDAVTSPFAGKAFEFPAGNNKFYTVKGDDIESISLAADGIPVIKFKPGKGLGNPQARLAKQKQDPDAIVVNSQGTTKVDPNKSYSQKRTKRKRGRPSSGQVLKLENKSVTVSMDDMTNSTRRAVLNIMEKAFQQKENLLIGSVPAIKEGGKALLTESDEEVFAEERSIDTLVLQKTTLAYMNRLNQDYKNENLSSEQKQIARSILEDILQNEEGDDFWAKSDARRKKLGIPSADKVQSYLQSREMYLFELLNAIAQE